MAGSKRAPEEKEPTLADIGRDLRRYAKVLVGFVVLIWVLEILSWALPIDRFGVHPRDRIGLIGVVTHPFLHIGVAHVFANSVGLLLFGAMIALKEESHLYVTFLLSTLLGGMGVWLFARGDTNHIGASGVVFGMLGYLMSTGLFERKIGSVILSVVVAVLWGSMLFGMSPFQSELSWEGHLFGFGAGIASAWLLAWRARRVEAKSETEIVAR